MSKNSERFTLTSEEKEKIKIPNASKYQILTRTEGRTTDFRNYSNKREIYKKRDSTPGP